MPKNFKYYDNKEDAQNNSGENTVADLTAKIDQRVYVGYDVKTVEEGGLDFTGATGYTLRGGKRYMRALYNPADNHSVSNRWSLRNQSLDYVGATALLMPRPSHSWTTLTFGSSRAIRTT